MAREALFNSFFFGGAAAFLAIGLTLFIAYVVHRKLVPFGGVLAFLCVAPFVIPGIVLAIGFYAAYAPPPLALYGTSLLLILAFRSTGFEQMGYRFSLDFLPLVFWLMMRSRIKLTLTFKAVVFASTILDLMLTFYHMSTAALRRQS